MFVIVLCSLNPPIKIVLFSYLFFPGGKTDNDNELNKTPLRCYLFSMQINNGLPNTKLTFIRPF